MDGNAELSSATVLPAPSGIPPDLLKLDGKLAHPSKPCSSSLNKLTDLLTDSESENEDGDDEATAVEAKAELIAELKESGIVAWVQRRLAQGLTPVDMLALFDPVHLPPDVDALHVLKLVLARVLSKRERRGDVNTAADAVRLIREAKHIVVLTGAGVSTSCGIPDFRSASGIYAKLQQETNGELTDPQEMFDIDFFRENPAIFYRFARDLYPSNFTPSASHRFIKLLELRGQLLRNYSQNIDTLEQAAGIERVLNCHGSFATAKCIVCGLVVPGESIKEDIFAQRVPLCPRCTAEAPPAPARPPPTKKRKRNPWDDESDEDNDNGLAPSEWLGKAVIKPSITFFGEKLDGTFGEHLLRDRESVDLLLVMGTSLKVAPVSDVLTHIPHSVPQILINRDPVTHCAFDVMLLGDCDAVVRWLCKELAEGWSVDAPAEPRRLGESHTFLFEGANEGHRWIRMMLSNAETV